MLEVIHPGPFTTIQDLGRTGFQRFGVSVTGAMDPQASALANLVIGNEPVDPVLEITLTGAKFQFHQPTMISITGADILVQLDGMELKRGCPIPVSGGEVVHFVELRAGCRAYLAVQGGLDVPEVMGSRSTFLRAAIGGLEGRALRKGDKISYTSRGQQKQLADWHVPTDLWWKKEKVRVLKGPEVNRFDAEQLNRFISEPYTISPQSDRMGYRLQGSLLKSRDATELVSEPVTFGTIQVPSGGEPIVLMADRQTTGGYPRIGQVIQVDLPVLAQKKPGDRVQFEFVSLEEARKLAAEFRQWQQDVRTSIEVRRRQDA